MRRWRVGTISMGILLIATGLLLLLSELNGINGARIIMRWWPVILIFLGIEVLAYLALSKSNGEEQPKLKFDGLSIFLTIVIILVSSGVYAANSFLGSNFSNVLLNEYGLYANESVSSISYDYRAVDIDTLEITNTQGDILVEKTTGDKIQIDAAMTIKSNDETDSDLAKDLIEITEGNTLKVNTRVIGALQGNKRYQVSVNYVVKVPKQMRFVVKNSYGKITLNDLTGDVDIQGDFGAVEVSRIDGDVTIRNSFGETIVSDVSGRLDIQNNNGEVVCRSNNAANNDITLRADFGSITLQLPSDQQGLIKAEADMGSIDPGGFASALKLISEEPGNNSTLEGSIGSKTPIITLHTNQGSIYLQNS
ncbi:DUF4097 domain-containing protein [Dehalobacter sp. DCM]|uniref:LiaI-LiaF-like domain-containing protein n=1 Tax=Dehalobacter sp. DCM TaxID=2907827 RepID=UPI0030818BD7|nr:DUF4097 domain-containing protein [Dehalobacter sp. DCM]